MRTPKFPTFCLPVEFFSLYIYIQDHAYFQHFNTVSNAPYLHLSRFVAKKTSKVTNLTNNIPQVYLNKKCERFQIQDGFQDGRHIY